jgi:hypothetical protein
MAAAQILTARQGDKLDQLLWREGGLGPGDLTRVLDANPGRRSGRDPAARHPRPRAGGARSDRHARPSLVQLWS